MTTTITQFTGGHNGSGGAPVDREDTVLIGGTAAAGDWLQATTVGGADGAGLSAVVVSDDVSGATGWEVDFDVLNGAGSDQIRMTAWKKLAVGGETTVICTWPGAANHCMVGFWAHNLAQPTLYLIDSGDAILDSGFMRFTAGAGLISSNGESYVGGVGFGRGGATRADFESPPSPTTEGGSGTLVTSAVGVIAHYNDDDAGTTADILTYQFQPPQNAYMFWYGFTDTAPVVGLAGSAGVIDATGTLEVTGGFTALGGSAAPLSATGALEVTGGELFMAGSAAPLSATGRLVAPFPHPVPGPPDRTDLLECGVYDAMVFTRGLGEIVGRLPFGQVDWARVLDGVSTASLTVDGVANRSQLQRCCALLGEVEPFEHELALYRNGYRVWSGPITAMSFPPNQIAISAFDLSGWLQLRTLHENHNAVAPTPGSDLIDIWISYVEDAMSVENSAGLHPTPLALSGILADRLTQITEHNLASDAIGELERTGIDWTTIDRVMQAGPVLTQPPPITDALEFPLLIDSSFRVPPTIMLDGLQGANCWFVQGGAAGAAGAPIFGEYGPAFPATPDHVAQPAAPDYATIEAQYGRIEKVVSESRALDQPSINDNARSRYDLTKRPVSVISEGLLLPTAPIAMRKLVPGSLVQIHLANACKPIGALYRIKSVKVSAHGDGSEDVNVEFQPLGTGTVLA